MPQLPSNPFFTSRSDRVELARQRYFEEGQMPSGVISDAVFQSWARCQRLHTDPHGKVEFQPVTASRAHLALQKNRPLHEAWLAELPRLEATLKSTSCAAMLTDATGVLIGSTCAGRSHEQLMPIATRIGVNLSEEAVGTTAPGVVARSGQPVCVMGSEHYFDSVKAMQCAAAPIRDMHGRMVGVLDISSEAMAFAFDAAAVVGIFAGAIENRLLIAQSADHLVIRIQVSESMLDSPNTGLLGVDTHGMLAWHNGVASRLVGLPASTDVHEQHRADVVLGLGLSELLDLTLSDPAPVRLPNGLLVWARVDLQARDGHRDLVAASPRTIIANHDLLTEDVPSRAVPSTADGAESIVAAEESSEDTERMSERTVDASLRESDRDLIFRALDECNGNVSKAARKLKVSRGLIYRRMGSDQGVSS
ncbi:helix-turn-helix domain-containing protein [Hydrogenophaga palleronii]|uniref:helix-turn-helix domain-containing protein n=1 Tax=Hydrogenophaga palleronii TaxID=65655 RepID=UPI000826A108|nr:helix-turn-helix domain-containing protein [Hydrogenophaga palleronii]